MSNSSHDMPPPDDRHDPHSQGPPSGMYAMGNGYAGEERRHPPGPASVMVNTGSNTPSLGLTGIWATVVNVSAASILGFLVISMYQDIRSELREARQQFREDMKIQRDWDAEQTKSIVSELRASRMSMERTEQRITSSPAVTKPE